jgi:hypothetical protein
MAEKNGHINILWYRGTKEHYHYLSHVYAMFGASDFRILDSELVIPGREIIPLTSDSTKFKRIGRIGADWKASRKDFCTGLWVPEPEGFTVAK